MKCEWVLLTQPADPGGSSLPPVGMFGGLWLPVACTPAPEHTPCYTHP